MKAKYCLRRFLPLLALTLLGCSPAEQQAEPLAVDQPSSVEAGRRMYRDGIRPSGAPLTAIVAGDVAVLGTQFSCESCHGRSGMGAAEGTYIVPPIAGRFLFVESPQPARPAYDQESLARLLREGTTPTGRNLGELMPRYALDDTEVAALGAFLEVQSAGISPGVDDTTIRFAVAITDDVPTSEREAVLAVLNQFVEEKNSNTRLESERWDRGNTPESRLPTVHREWVLDVWTLTGPGEGWQAQLEERYRRQPVFGMLSGLSNSSWDPVGRFCERHEIPCLFPGANLASAEKGDFYTLYYSRGLALEAALIAHHMSADGVSSVIQVHCEVGPAQATAELERLLHANDVSVQSLAFDCGRAFPAEDLAELVAADPQAAVVLWLNREQIIGIEDELPPGRVYFSSTLLGGVLEGEFPSVPGSAFVAHPFRLPGQFDPAFARFEVWAKTRGIELSSPRRQSEAFFACLALKEGTKHIGRFFVRDYLMDTLDHAQSLVAYLPFHPRPTLGPQQRFLSKGGYVLPVVDGQASSAAPEWILP